MHVRYYGLFLIWCLPNHSKLLHILDKYDIIDISMENAIKESLTRWNGRYSERQKLQHVYLVIIIAATLVAGLLSLVNRDLGFTTLRIALVGVVVYVANGVVWSVLYSSLLVNLKTRSQKR